MNYLIPAIIFWISSLLAAITIPVYFLVLLVLFTNRDQPELRSTFFRICTLNGFIDLLSLFNNYFGSIFPANNLFIGFYLGIGPITGQVYLVIAWSSRFWQGFAVLLLSLNRATATLSPTSYARYWTMRNTSYIYFAQLFPGVLIGSALFFTTFTWANKANGWYIEFNDQKFRTLFFTTAFLGDAIVVLIIMISYIVMIYSFRKRFTQVLKTTNTKNNYFTEMSQKKALHERGLINLSLSVCSLEILYFIFIVYAFGINTHMETELFFLIYNTLQNLYSCAPPYLILLYSYNFKRSARQAIANKTTMTASFIFTTHKLKKKVHIHVLSKTKLSRTKEPSRVTVVRLTQVL